MKEQGQREFCGAVDVGGTKISAALFTSQGRMLGRKKILIDKRSPEKPVRQIVGLIKDMEVLARKKRGAVRAVGVCIPGIVFPRSGRVWTVNIPGWEYFPLKARLSKWIKLPLVLASDRSAYVLGEQWRGAAKKKQNVVFLAVGTGIGAGILVNGRVCHGSQDISGAVGWFALNPHFKPGYAARGCFETEASGSAVARRARELLEAGESSLLDKIVGGKREKITAETVARAALKKDKLAQEVMKITASYLAMGIANIVSLLNPEMVVLGGGLFQAGEILLGPVRRDVKKWAQPVAAKRVRIELSSLGENTGLYGAGKLAWDSFRK